MVSLYGGYLACGPQAGRLAAAKNCLREHGVTNTYFCRMEFNTAKEYAHYVKTYLHEYGAEPDDLELRLKALKERYGNRVAEAGIVLPKIFTPLNTAYQEVVKQIANEFYQTLPEPVRQQFAKRFYFTTIDNRTTNASISRSPDGRFYGVFIFSALITALHRLGKLELAVLFPEEVFSCSRFPGESATREKMVEIYAEVHSHFLETKIPLGPQVLLNEPLNSQHMFKLDIQEKLILFHEVAHFLNGDLKFGANEQYLAPQFPNQSYQREHLADVIAFGLLLRQLKLSGPVTREYRYLMLMCLINLHQIQHEIQGIETADYPHPLNRMGVVIDKFYGHATEEWVGEALLNNRTHELAYENFPEIESGEENILSYIEQQLVRAFDD